MDGADAQKVLVFGGARSGKSQYAESLAARLNESHNSKIIYLATAEVRDDEFKGRVDAHRARRPGNWVTMEEPMSIAPLVLAANDSECLLIDCATLWLTNHLLAESDLAGAIAALVAALNHTTARVIIVSNETGQGIVPGTKMGRQFRDWQGMLNAQLAGACDTVVKVEAGLPRLLKPHPEIQIW